RRLVEAELGERVPQIHPAAEINEVEAEEPTVPDNPGALRTSRHQLPPSWVRRPHRELTNRVRQVVAAHRLNPRLPRLLLVKPRRILVQKEQIRPPPVDEDVAVLKRNDRSVAVAGERKSFPPVEKKPRRRRR